MIQLSDFANIAWHVAGGARDASAISLPFTVFEISLLNQTDRVNTAIFSEGV